MIEVIIKGFGKGGDQVFKAESESERIDKLREAQRHATRKIREQAREIRMLRAMLTETMTCLVTTKLK